MGPPSKGNLKLGATKKGATTTTTAESTPPTPTLSAAEIEEIQKTELEVISAILSGDFSVAPPPTAWNKASSSSSTSDYHIVLRPDDDSLKQHIQALLHLHLPKRYPLVPPILTIKNQDERTKGLNHQQISELLGILVKKAKELVGMEMIWELVSTASSALTQNAKVQTRSLEEEKKIRASEEEKALKERASLEQTKRQEEDAARASALAAQIEKEAEKKSEEIRLQRERRRGTGLVESASFSSPMKERKTVGFSLNSNSDSLVNGIHGSGMSGEGMETFLDPIEDGGRTTSVVKVGPVVDRAPLFTRYLCESAHNDPSSGDAASLTWILERWLIISPHYNSSSGKRKVEEVESELDKLKKLRESGLVNVLANAVIRNENGWKLTIVTEIHRGTRMSDLLDLCGSLPWSKVKNHLLNLLSGLDTLHNHNLLHRNVTLENIVIDSMSKTDVAGSTAKLSHSGYARRLLDMHRSNPIIESSAASPFQEELVPLKWQAPEAQSQPLTYNRKRDIFDLGRCACQMLCGVEVIEEFNSPAELIRTGLSHLPEHVRIFLQTLLEPVPRQRPPTSEILLRLQDICAYEETVEPSTSGEGASNSKSNRARRTFQRAPSSGKIETLSRKPVPPPPLSAQPGSFWSLRGAQGAGISRYQSDFIELAFLGKGAFGSVAKVKNRLDGRIYAVKKINLSSSAENDERTMREITALSRLDHPHIVRYVTCWIQEEEVDDKGANSSSETMTTSSMSQSIHPSGPGGSTDEEEFAVFGADDFLSLENDAFSKSASYPSIRFAGSDDSSESSSEEESESDSNRSRSSSIRASRMSQSQLLPTEATSAPRPRSLYIQMEYVEGATLREALDRGLSIEESWSIFRMCLEALAHVSSLGLIHRDLKPANLLLLPSGDVRVADFGLATTQAAEGGAQGPMGTAEDLTGESTDLTSDIGTNLYISPEAMTGARYNHKVDMYSLGITFFEMLAAGTIYQTGMERLSVIRDLRSPAVKLPPSWPTEKLPNQTKIIRWLLDHDPDKRPTPLELLKTDLLPPKLEDEYVEETLRLMSNPSSAYNHQLLEALFDRTEILDPVRDFTFETGAESNEDNRLVSVVCELLRGIFHRHGAVELHAPLLVPPNELYLSGERKPVQLLDKTGKVVLLPYDLTVPFARVAARSENQRLKRYAIAPVYRENLVAGGQPRSVLEVDFDIVSPEKTSAAEGEVFSVLEEILDEIPQLSSDSYVIQINHSEVIELVLERVPKKLQAAVISSLAGLASKSTSHAARLKLQKLPLPRSVLDEIEASNISDDIDVVHSRLDRLLAVDHRPRLSRAVKELKEIISSAQKFGVQRKFLFTPLLIVNSSLYSGGMLFQLVKMGKRKDVLAAGGRYDSLLKHFASPTLRKPPAKGVGCQLAVGKLALALARDENIPRMMSKPVEEERSFGRWSSKRCDVYVASGPGLFPTRIEICRELWAAGISADLSYQDSPADALPLETSSMCRQEGIMLLVFARAARSAFVRVKHSLHRGEEEVARHELVSWIQDQISRQRLVDSQTGMGTDHFNSATINTPSGALASSSTRGVEVVPPDCDLLLPERAFKKNDHNKGSDRRTKPPSRQLLLDKASKEVSKISETILRGEIPVIAVDLTGLVFERLSALQSEEGFRSLLEGVTGEERSYLKQIREQVQKHEKVFLFSIREGRICLVT